MSAQPAYPAGPLRAERGGLAPLPTSVPKMSLYDLMARFWQLNDEHAFTAKETRLYFYLLNEFNTARWAARIYRKTTQICADLSADKNTVNGARAALEARGLVFYKAGNPGASAIWSLTEEVKDSPMEVKNSPLVRAERLEVGVKNSPQVPPIGPERLEVEVNFSPPYKEEEKTLGKEEEKTPTGAAGAASSAAEKKIGSTLPAEQPNTSAAHTEGGATNVGTAIAASKPAQVPPEEAPAFLAFWQVYPRHDGKVKAAQAFARLSAAEQALATELAPAFFARRADWISPEGTDYRPYAATWLSGKRWKEATEPQPLPTTPPPPTHATHSAFSKPGTARHHVPAVTSYGKL